MRCAVLVFPGSNCDYDLYKAVNSVEGMEAEYVWYAGDSLKGFDAILLPGGFSYGDALRAGALAARAPILKALRQAADSGVRVLGICNGFQILTECGLLPGALHRNSGLRFICDTVSLQVANTATPFTSGYAERAEFRYAFRSLMAREITLAMLKLCINWKITAKSFSVIPAAIQTDLWTISRESVILREMCSA